MSYYTVTEWSDGAFRITSAESVYMELIVGSEKALLFDTGWGLGRLYEQVRRLTDKPLIVVNSHGHLDHVNGNAQFGEDIYINPNDMELVHEHGSPIMRERILRLVEGGNFLPPGFCRDEYLKESIKSYLPAEDGFVFELGGNTMKVIELPGHTRGSIGLLYSEKNILFVGDAVNGFMIMNRPESASMDTYINTLEKVRSMGVTKMIASHSKSMLNMANLDEYLKLAKSVDWDLAEPYEDDGDIDGSKGNASRVMYALGVNGAREPGCACVIFSKDKLHGAEL